MNENNDYSTYSPYLNTYVSKGERLLLYIDICTELQLNKLLKHSFIGFVFPEIIKIIE